MYNQLYRIPCYARRQVCYFVKFNYWQENEIKEVKLKTTKHGITLRIDVTSKPWCTYFACPNWRALCKAYALEEGMKITFDLGPSRRDVFKNKDISMLVDDKKLVLSQREFNFLTKFTCFLSLFFFASQVDNFVIIATLSLCSDGYTQDVCYDFL